MDFAKGESTKFDDGKLPYDLLPVSALRDIVEVYRIGSLKYGPHNWRKGMKWSRVYSAIQRHLNAFWEGEDLNPGPGMETGLKHLAQAAWGILTLLEYCRTRPEFDDRWKEG